MKPSVLVVDDDRCLREGLAKALRLGGFQVCTADNGLSGFAETRRQRFDAIVLDIMMPVVDGMYLYEALETEDPRAAGRVLFVSGWFNDPDVERFLHRTGRPVLPKPLDIHEVVRQIRILAAPTAAASPVPPARQT